MLALAGVAAFLLLIIVASARAHADDAGGGADTASDAVARANLTADPAKLEEHAAAADRAGYPQTAAVIRSRAQRIRASEKALAPTPGAQNVRSPVPEATDATWTRYMETIAGSNATNTVSPAGALGLFGLTLPRLADLGLVSNVHKDAAGKWAGDWVAPLSREAFLGDLKMQYETFVKATLADRKAIIARHPDAIGRALAHKVATLSGLLGAAHQAGMHGLDAWLASNADRVKFPRTTNAFLRSNGLY